MKNLSINSTFLYIQSKGLASSYFKVLMILLLIVFYQTAAYSQENPTENETLEFINSIISKVSIKSSTNRISAVQSFDIDVKEKIWTASLKFSDGSVKSRLVSLKNINGKESLREVKDPSCIILSNEFQIFPMEMMVYNKKVKANVDEIAFNYDATIPGERERLINALWHLIELKKNGVGSFFEPKK